MSKSVEDGVLKQLSPSSINKFDATQAFGCERRWWFRYVKGLDEPQLSNQFLGESVHALIEARLTKLELGMMVDPEAYGIYLAGEAMIEDVAKRTIIGIETPLRDFKLDGVKVQGYVDVVTSDGIIDWKTSSDIRRYGKTEADLAVDTQMNIYARAMHPDLEVVKLAHGQFQTKGNKRTAFVEVEISQRGLAAHESNVIIPLVQKMKSAASESDVRKLPRNEKSCFNCAYKTHCPSNEGDSIMSFFSKMKSAEVVLNTTVAPKVDVSKLPPVTAQVLPPDAPASNPTLAAKPVEGFSPVPPARKMTMIDVPEPAITAPATPFAIAQAAPPPAAPPVEEIKKKAGRPPGAKNKPKDVESSNLAPSLPRSLGVITYVPEQTVGVVKFTGLTVSKGFTVNLGSFNNVRFEVAASGEGNDYAALEAALLEKVEASLEREASKYQAEVDAKTHASVAAQNLVCK
jgi:CRISPR/Cas system-associated exonuclease Cas4 (RecB family)